MDKPWLQFYEPGVPESLDYPDDTLDVLLSNTARRFPDRPAIIFFDKQLSYREVDEAVSRFAAALQHLGLEKGDRVAVHMPNCPQFVIAYYGTLRAGGVVVPTNPTYTSRELHHQLNDSGARAIVTLTMTLERVQAVRDETPVEHVIVTNIKDYFPPLLKLLFTLFKEKKEGHAADIRGLPTTYWFLDLLRRHSPESRRPAGTTKDDLAVLGYTGGTTGVPKGAMLLHRNLVANALQVRAWTPGLREGQESVLGALPLFHSYGMTTVMNFAVAVGGAMILLPNPRELDRVLKLIDKYQPTFFPGVPTLYTAINNHPDVRKYNLRSVKYCLSGASSLPVEVQKQFEELTGAKVVEGYGLTETSPVTHANPLNGVRKPGSIGIPVPDTMAKIVHIETGEELPVGEVGEIIIHGPQVMAGYHNRPRETEATLRTDAEGRTWLHTGDVARMDEDGYFYIVDRKKDLIIASGYNVYPREVEEVLYEHPKVLEAAVVGVPHPYRGETVKAFVVLREGETLNEEELIQFCRDRLAPYKVPKLVEFRDSLPKTTVGKILRRQLAEEERRKAQEQEGAR
ncbi:MAG: long-chain fatty acid--CoA ligase [Ardenticatenia bacterium]|nr:long-chain fatty acid--CoA ligase [Ardenticatenia bacterium]